MISRKRQTAGPAKVAETVEDNRGRPEVIIEFLFDRGFFHICVRNIGDRPAVGISTRFNKKITGLGGRKEISTLPLFRNIEFLGPGREIVMLLDASDSYFSRKQPTKISVQITYSDSEKTKYEATINHDLEIYRELPYLARSEHNCVDRTAD
ncbi:MAG TPA: hypothetical protein VGK77_06960 [Candidatus Binatia bacterium]|jgi:hypothetical protein